MRKDRISYSQCWEDPHLLLTALAVSKTDSVLSITSGGDNTLALLCKAPNSLTSVDFSPAQNYLLELKLAAAWSLTYENYLAFLGKEKTNDRIKLFQQVRGALSPEADAWWSSRSSLISQGVIHCGRFERFTAFFAKYVLPVIQGQSTIRTLLMLDNPNDQQEFYEKRWDNPLWKAFFGLAASRLLLGRARASAMFAHTQARNIASIYRNRLERYLKTKPVRGNFFLQYSLTGEYVDALPPYLTKDCFVKIKSTTPDKLQIILSDILSYLRSMPEQSFSKFNLSDVFEALSLEEHESIWKEIIRTAKPGARLVYWINLVPRPIPSSVAGQVHDESSLTQELQAQDRVFFYEGFRVHTILK